MRIEILGPSGVGKSTIIASVRHLWTGRVMFPDDLASFLNKPSGGDTAQMVERIFARDTLLAKKYFAYALGCIANANMSFRQKFTAITTLHDSMLGHIIYEHLDLNGGLLLHDELLLSRGFGFLHRLDDFETAAEQYYETVPVPEVAVILKAPAPVIVGRIKERGESRNCDAGLDEAGLKLGVMKKLAICSIAAATLAKRGVDVRVLDVSRSLEDSSTALNDIIYEALMGDTKKADAEGYVEALKTRSTRSSDSFRRKNGRHFPKTRDVIYCAFTTPNFTVERSESQRDAATRYANFGLDKNALQGKRVLDLGAHIGAMLFQATNYGIAEGLGVEYDYDKVKVAREIAALSNLDNLSFRQGDIDKLVADELGQFDVTFALAVEGHILDQERFYELLGRVTGEVLYFEGNGQCDVENATRQLYAAGFREVHYLGFCTDDVRPDNNGRPMLKAVK